MAIKDWSTVANNNATVGAIDWAEGQPPSKVNDSAREMMAQLAGLLHDTFNNIKEYGAVGDGITDDTSAIQAALDADDHIYIPSTDNYYKITSALTLSANHVITGNGETSEIRQATANTTIFSGQNIDNLTIRNVHLYAVGTSNSEANGICIYLVNCDKVSVLDNLFSNLGGHGVFMQSCEDGLVRGNKFVSTTVTATGAASDARGDINLRSESKRCIVEGNHCVSGCGHGVWIATAAAAEVNENHVIRGNVIANHIKYGIIAYNGDNDAFVDNIVIADNNISNITGALEDDTDSNKKKWGAGIYIQHAEHCSITGNVLSDIAGSADAPATSGANASAAAIGLTLVSSASITGNIIVDAAVFGIAKVGDSGRTAAQPGIVTISANELESVAYSGIWVLNTGNTNITGNTLMLCGTDSNDPYGIQLEPTSGTDVENNIAVTGNVLIDIGSSNDGAGIWVAGSGGLNNVIINDNIVVGDNTLYGITLGATTASVLYTMNDNLVDGADIAASSGIIVGANHSVGTIRNNVISDFATGINIGSKSAVSGNTFTSCTANYGGVQAAVAGRAVSAANLADATHWVNTQDKFDGQSAWETSNDKVYFARGSGTTDQWVLADSTGAVTPS